MIYEALLLDPGLFSILSQNKVNSKLISIPIEVFTMV